MLSSRTLCPYDTREVTVGISQWLFGANELPVKDLNYRLNLPDADVRHLLCSTPTPQDIHALLQFDEVRLFEYSSDIPLNHSSAAAEGFYSSLQSIHGIRRTSYNFPSVACIGLREVASANSFNRTYRFAANTHTDAAGYDIKYFSLFFYDVFL